MEKYQKFARQQHSTSLFSKYEEDGNDLLAWIITGDENWINFYEPER